MSGQLPIYIISLKKDHDRRAFISEQLTALDLNFEFIDAVWGADLSDEERSHLHINTTFEPTAAEIGCSLSHQLAYKKMLSVKQEWAIFLEDDVTIDSSLKDFVNNFSEEKKKSPPHNALYILGGQEGLSSRRKISCSIFNRFVFGNVVVSRVTYSPRYLFRTCCYLINASVAQNLISEFDKQYYIADHWDYLQKRGCFENIFFTEIIHHPIVTIYNSHIEAERKSKNIVSRPHRKKGKVEESILNFFFSIKKNFRRLKY